MTSDKKKDFFSQKDFSHFFSVVVTKSIDRLLLFGQSHLRLFENQNTKLIRFGNFFCSGNFLEFFLLQKLVSFFLKFGNQESPKESYKNIKQ